MFPRDIRLTPTLQAPRVTKASRPLRRYAEPLRSRGKFFGWNKTCGTFLPTEIGRWIIRAFFKKKKHTVAYGNCCFFEWWKEIFWPMFKKNIFGGGTNSCWEVWYVWCFLFWDSWFGGVWFNQVELVFRFHIREAWEDLPLWTCRFHPATLSFETENMTGKTPRKLTWISKININ